MISHSGEPMWLFPSVVKQLSLLLCLCLRWSPSRPGDHHRIRKPTRLPIQWIITQYILKWRADRVCFLFLHDWAKLNVFFSFVIISACKLSFSQLSHSPRREVAVPGHLNSYAISGMNFDFTTTYGSCKLREAGWVTSVNACMRLSWVTNLWLSLFVL